MPVLCGQYSGRSVHKGRESCECSHRRISGPRHATTERATVLAPFNLTERQARFLATVMLHSGVFVGRQYAAFAGITHGQKVHDLVEKLLVRRFVTAIELGSTGRTRIFHVHHKPLYAAIGEPEKASASDRATDASAWQSWWQRAQPTFRVKTREAELDLQAFLTCPL